MIQHFYKLLLVLTLLLITHYNYAQCTVDTTFKTPGIYPTILPNGRVGEVYNQVLQFFMNKDTTVSGIPATIDSFSIAKINGFPNGISYVCNTLNCTIPGGSNGCLTVSGIPTVKGFYPIQIIKKVRAKALGFTTTRYDTITNYSLTINSIAPSNLKYNDSIVIATRTITNINSIVTYSGDTIINFSINPNLPTGVALNNKTGKISGIPTVLLPQTIFTITGTNTGGSTTASFTLKVNKVAPSLMSYSPNSIIANRANTNINATPIYLGDSITSFTISPSLPTGVTLNNITGKISGIPTVLLPQTIFTITGTNSVGSTTASFTITVNPALSINMINSNDFLNLSFKPNPFTNETEISYVSKTKEVTKLVIIDAFGKEIYTKTIQSVIGNNIIIIDELYNLNTGIYIARLVNNTGFSQPFKLEKK